MKRLVCKLILLFILLFSFTIIYVKLNPSKSFLQRNVNKLYTLNPATTTNNKVKNPEKPDRVVISSVVCESRFEEALSLIKSSLLFTQVPIHFIIFTDNILWDKLTDELNKWKLIVKNLSFELHKISFPESHKKEWMNLFSKCAAQRLFVPKLLPHIDATIYVDTDTLFLGPVDELWNYFTKFNSSQMAAMVVENSDINLSWYSRFANHPFYGKHGLNSGVILMNLTRMREFGWVDYVTPIMLKWKWHIPWGDQDIINIIFHYHGRALLELPCRYNYRPDQCMYGELCPAATERGVFVVHGSRQAFHRQRGTKDEHPAFQAVYRAIHEYNIIDDPLNMLANMEKYLSVVPSSYCADHKEAFIKVPNETLRLLHPTINVT